MKKTSLYLSAAAVVVTLASAPLYATDDHHHGHDDGHGHSHNEEMGMTDSHHQDDMGMEDSHHEDDMGMADMPGHIDGIFLVKKHIDDYDVSFHVMAAQPGMEHGGGHNFMIKVERDGKPLDDIKINSKVVHPNGSAESKPLMKMGEWYMNGYDLGHAGRHQLMILFKTADGKKHKGGIYFPEK